MIPKIIITGEKVVGLETPAGLLTIVGCAACETAGCTYEIEGEPVGGVEAEAAAAAVGFPLYLLPCGVCGG